MILYFYLIARLSVYTFLAFFKENREGISKVLHFYMPFLMLSLCLAPCGDGI